MLKNKKNIFLKKWIIIPALLIALLPAKAVSQNMSINATGTAPNNSAILDVSSTTSGFLIPRMTTPEMNAISSPATGLLVYNTDCQTICYYNGASWVIIGNGSGMATPGVITGSTIACPNALAIDYSISSVNNAIGYNWTVPTGATVTSGQGTTDITVNFGSSSGNVCVTASDYCGTSSPSCISVTLAAVTPGVPDAIAATGISCSVFFANWNAVGGATSYSLDFSSVSNFATYTVISVGYVTTYQKTGLSSSTNYYYRVRCTNGCSTSANSNTITVTTSASGGHGSQTFSYTGAQQVFTIPCGITSVTISASGAQGGTGWRNSAPSTEIGGKGGNVVASFTVTAGQTLYVYVGEKGKDHNGYCGNIGGGGIAPVQPLAEMEAILQVVPHNMREEVVEALQM